MHSKHFSSYWNDRYINISFIFPQNIYRIPIILETILIHNDNQIEQYINFSFAYNVLILICRKNNQMLNINKLYREK
jgi:hypothetical protein